MVGRIAAGTPDITSQLDLPSDLSGRGLGAGSCEAIAAQTAGMAGAAPPGSDRRTIALRGNGSLVRLPDRGGTLAFAPCLHTEFTQNA